MDAQHERRLRKLLYRFVRWIESGRWDEVERRLTTPPVPPDLIEQLGPAISQGDGILAVAIIRDAQGRLASGQEW